MEARSEIAEWYRDKAVFITGATGFVGKVLLEKLLRSFPDIGPIYVLVREKKGTLPQDRVKEIMSSNAFDEVRASRRNWRNLVIPVFGDIGLFDLGISAEDRRLLQDTVSVVFHVAATVKFDNALRTAVAINLEGTKALMQLCLGMTKLGAVVHVSTAYTNCHVSVIEERVYPPPADLDKIEHCVAGMDDDLLEIITPRLIGNHPNTYTFTKALAEHVVVGYSSKLPIVMVRPSIIVASWREPSPGWIDSFNGPTGILVGGGKGLLTLLYGQGDLVADLIPVDVCANLFIAAAWEIGTREGEGIGPRVLVYNCVSRPFKPISWKEFFGVMNNCVQNYPFSEFLSNPSIGMTHSRVKYVLHYAFKHALPGTLADIVIQFTGGIPWFRSSQRKLKRIGSSIEFFVTHEFEFKANNVERLRRRLNPADRMIFDFEMRDINWKEYINTYFLGIRKHMMKEKSDTIDTCRQKVIKRAWLTTFVQIGVLVVGGISLFLWLIFGANSGIKSLKI